MSVTPGETLLQYRVVEKIGEGGMGVVWKAVDGRLDREVAIKILPDSVATDPERLARFDREAKLLASLNHPNIATVHGLHQDGETRFLAMELVRGEDLAKRLSVGALPIEDAVDVCRQIATALEAAHEQGVIHRDLKPANVIVSAEGQAKVLDFGLAKSFETTSASSDPSLSPTLTTAPTIGGMILGTAAFMSPEQARGQPVDRRADIWAFGCVLFECLTGRRCFTGETVSDTLAAVLRAEPEWSALPPGVPRSLEMLLRRCLERDPRSRLRDIGEARVLLERPLDEPTGAAVEPAVAPRRWPTLVAALALAGLAALVAWNLHTPSPLPLRKFASYSDAVTDGEWDAGRPAISPDGTRLAFARNRQLWIRDLARLEAHPVPDSEGVQGIFWSPDSRWVGYAVGLRLWKVEAAGAAPIAVGHLPGRMSPAGGAAWLDDGTWLLTTGGSGLLSVSSQGGDPVTVLEPELGENDFHDVERLPDGRSVVFIVHGKQGAGLLAVFDGKERRDTLELAGQWLRKPTYAPSGHLLFQRSTGNVGIWAVPFSLDRLEATGEPFLVVPGGGAPSCAADGTLVYLQGAATRSRQLTFLDRSGKPSGTVGEPQLELSEPALSPDGTRVAVSAATDGQRDIWIYDVESGTRSRLTFTPESESYPRWFPDGQRVAFLCGEPSKICVQRADGSGASERIPVDVSETFDISPDGDRIVFDQSAPGTRSDLWLDEGGAPRAFLATPDFESDPRISRNGALVAHVAWELGMEEVFLREFPEGDGKWQVSTSGGDEPVWSNDEIFWIEGSLLRSRSLTIAPEVRLGPAQTLFRHGALNWGYDVTPDGRRILLAVAATEERETALVIVQNWFAEFAER